MRSLQKYKYYVKSNELEKWVLAFDETNAAVVAVESAAGGIALDPYFVYVSRDYVENIEASEASTGVHKIPTDSVIEILQYVIEEDGLEPLE